MADDSQTATDNLAYRYPVSIKGVVVNSGRLALLKNERNEWELPGGKLEPGETPAQCLTREISEEIGIPTHVRDILDAWVYEVSPKTCVLIVTFGIAPIYDAKFILSCEHKELAEFQPNDIEHLQMPKGYKSSIRNWLACLANI
ncbi:MAG: NUDIX domain-containing protein [Rhodospirillaceae bacterium]|nr:MAG: NUDIX domain-containing protein [Rhodospirillaceae bacterium]